jgi:hypothetical protein
METIIISIFFLTISVFIVTGVFAARFIYRDISRRENAQEEQKLDAKSEESTSTNSEEIQAAMMSVINSETFRKIIRQEIQGEFSKLMKLAQSGANSAMPFKEGLSPSSNK